MAADKGSAMPFRSMIPARVNWTMKSQRGVRVFARAAKKQRKRAAIPRQLLVKTGYQQVSPAIHSTASS